MNLLLGIILSCLNYWEGAKRYACPQYFLWWGNSPPLSLPRSMPLHYMPLVTLSSLRTTKAGQFGQSNSQGTLSAKSLHTTRLAHEICMLLIWKALENYLGSHVWENTKSIEWKEER